MPPKQNKTASSGQSLIRPVLQAASSPAAAMASVLEKRASAVSIEDPVASRTELVRAVVAELQTILNDHYSKIKTELHDFRAELSRDFAALRSELAAVKNTVSEVEHTLSACTDDTAALQNKVEFLTKELVKLDEKCEDLEARSRRQNVRIVGVPEDGSFSVTTANVSKLLKDAFSMDKCPVVDRAHRSLAPVPKPGASARSKVARLHYYEDCVDILGKARRKQRITVSGMTISVFPDFTAKTSKARAAFNNVRKLLRDMEGVKYGMFYPARLRITHNGKHRDFTSAEEAMQFVVSIAK